MSHTEYQHTESIFSRNLDDVKFCVKKTVMIPYTEILVSGLHLRKDSITSNKHDCYDSSQRRIFRIIIPKLINPKWLIIIVSGFSEEAEKSYMHLSHLNIDIKYI